MTLSQKLADELKRRIGFSEADPQTVTLSGSDGIDIAVDFTAVERMSCSFREIRLSAPALAGAEFDTLKRWGESLCQRVTYLLENIGPLELDPDKQQVLIRSIPPDQQENGTRFYEILLQSHADGNFSLRRYESQKGQPGRTQVDIQTTHEVLQKLVTDLVETIPVP